MVRALGGPGSIPRKDGIFFQLCFIPLLRLSCRKTGHYIFGDILDGLASYAFCCQCSISFQCVLFSANSRSSSFVEAYTFYYYLLPGWNVRCWNLQSLFGVYSALCRFFTVQQLTCLSIRYALTFTTLWAYSAIDKFMII